MANPSQPVSLLSPPNPSLSPTTPSGSILLNRNDKTCIPPTKQSSATSQSKIAGVGKAIKSSFSLKDVPDLPTYRQAAPPAAVYNGRNRSASAAGAGSRPGLARANSSKACVSFAPLPEMPTDLTRRKSITLGVAARSNILKTQGNAAGGASGRNQGFVLMNDEEWERYKQEMAAKNRVDDVPELHTLVMKSGKKLWNKARSLSSSSSTSSLSTTSDAPEPYFTRGRTGSTTSFTSNTSESALLDQNRRASTSSLGLGGSPQMGGGTSLKRANSGSRTRMGIMARLKGQRDTVPEDAVMDDLSEAASDIGTIPEDEDEEDLVDGGSLHVSAEGGKDLRMRGLGEEEHESRTARNSIDGGAGDGGTARNSPHLRPALGLLDVPENAYAGSSSHIGALDLDKLDISHDRYHHGDRKSRLRESEKKEYAAVMHADEMMVDDDDEEEAEDVDKEWAPDEEMEESENEQMDVDGEGRRASLISGTGTQDKPYICGWDGCGKAYTKPAKLKEHQLSHTGERPFKCPQCTATYTRSNHLQRHMNSHKAPEGKAFVCEREGCGKAFWTREKLVRHYEAHEDPEVRGLKRKKNHNCPHCDRVFHKHTQLRSHVVGEHSDLLATNQPPSRRSGSGKNTPTALAPSNITITIDQLSSALSQTVANAAMPGPHESSDIRFRPFQCDVPGCEWSFETAQRLKMHKKTHKTDRYMCYDEAHGTDFPRFAKWTELQAHVKTEHPPTCPYPMCHKRVFKSNQNLKEHLKVHIEHGHSLTAETAQVSIPPSASSILSEMTMSPSNSGRGRKRKQGGQADSLDLDSPVLDGTQTPQKKLKRTSSDIGKDWLCRHPGCDKMFKTKRALSVHNSTAHLRLRPFACPHPICGKSYGHKHLLQRHIAARHRKSRSPSGAPSEVKSGEVQDTKVDTGVENEADLLSGMHYLQNLAKKPLQCPLQSVAIEIQADAGGNASSSQRCLHRSARVYDVQRHIRKVHGLNFDEEEVRVLLRDAQQENGEALAAK